jgi:hypothetical protein
MSEPHLLRDVRRRLAIIRHVEEVTGNVPRTSRDGRMRRYSGTMYWSWRS